MKNDTRLLLRGLWTLIETPVAVFVGFAASAVILIVLACAVMRVLLFFFFGTDMVSPGFAIWLNLCFLVTVGVVIALVALDAPSWPAKLREKGERAGQASQQAAKAEAARHRLAERGGYRDESRNYK